LILDIFLPYFREDFKTEADFNCERLPLPVKKICGGLENCMPFSVYYSRWSLVRGSWFVGPWVFEREQHEI